MPKTGMQFQEFIQSITSDDIANDVSHHLDRFDTLYYMMGAAKRAKTDICTTYGKDGKLGFSLLVEREEDAPVLAEQLDGIQYTSYGTCLYVRAKAKNKDCVSISMTKIKGEG